MNLALQIEPDLASDLELARQVQMNLLSKRASSLRIWNFEFSCEPAAAVLRVQS